MFIGANGGQTPTRGQQIAIAAAHVRSDIAFAAVDIFLVVSAYTLGLALRMLDPLVGDEARLWLYLAIAMPFIVLIHIVTNVLAGAYGHVWEHASTSEAARVVVSNAVTFVLLVGLNGVIRLGYGIVVPWSVLVVGSLLSLFGMGLVRFQSRLFSFHKVAGATRVLVVGTGVDAVAFARRASTMSGARKVVGFLSDTDEPISGGVLNGDRRLAGLGVLGLLTDVATVVESHAVDEVVVVGGGSRRARRVVDLCIDVDVRLRLVPGAEELMSEGATAVDVRDISVEDILVREPVKTDLSLMKEMIEGKRVLITGAGGSIGSEIVRQVLGFEPDGVWALDRDETLIHHARLRWPDPTFVELGDIRDAGRLLRVFERVRPQIVFHAAALKHVPILEDHPEEAVLTNVIGTRNVIEAGSRAGMEHFVLISTDKAVSPESVMGATKRAAEIMVQAGRERYDNCTYSAVRFGNVLGSRGSVIPTFIEQIKAGGPVTVTDPEMMRYFMTVNEAVQLVLQASALAEGSEVFLLDMGEPVRIVDLARRLIRLAGLSPGKDIEINFTGRRPGEKLTEVLATEPLRPTLHQKVFEVPLAQTRPDVLMAVVADLEQASLQGDRRRVKALLVELTDSRLSSADDPVVLEGQPAAMTWS